ITFEDLLDYYGP
nr:Chain T, INHIBITOR OF CAPSID ASSEMBLY [synthetic construct]3DS0_T Chain T, Peptide inhibitor of capsid assembly [synthetic construct]3DS1_T Chain T, Peptide Inhibitor of capsid assembly [synthetic construct]3DS3_C Chain C, Peptide inhibitor of capsid assembly [synthetic construct]3DS3_D Chain D, Peptide inhibitor of capsid assembly [synthetic construct]3DS4_T Chain T, Peptide inhibitor of capsid assembly [synthetic construct]